MSSEPRTAIGTPVDPSPARRPVRTVIEGVRVTLAPLNPEAHAEALWEATRGPANEYLWRYLFEGPFADRAEFDAYLRKRAASNDPLFFTILDSASVPLGWAAYMRIEPAHRVIEVGSILFTPALQRTPAATEAMYLMARHVFEELGYRRYEWKCNSLNEPSRRAALRLGFCFEGVFRQHMIIKAHSRDTAWYSMLDSEWPARKREFEEWLSPANFDAQGMLKRSLASLRAGQS